MLLLHFLSRLGHGALLLVAPPVEAESEAVAAASEALSLPLSLTKKAHGISEGSSFGLVRLLA